MPAMSKCVHAGTYGEQTIAQFRTHDVTNEVAYVSTQQSGYFTIDTEMI
jgi:hypothetical protein